MKSETLSAITAHFTTNGPYEETSGLYEVVDNQDPNQPLDHTWLRHPLTKLHHHLTLRDTTLHITTWSSAHATPLDLNHSIDLNDPQSLTVLEHHLANARLK